MEWNDSALAVIFALFLIPVVGIYFILRWIITRLTPVNSHIVEIKKSRMILYAIIQIGLVILSVGLATALIGFLTFIKGGGLLAQ
jgi:hypothetical protein